MAVISDVVVAPEANDGQSRPTVSGCSRSVRAHGRLSDSRFLAWGLLGLLLVLFVVQAWPRVTAPFADTHDGENAAVWGLSSRAIRQDGFLASRGGARLAGGSGLYAHHPPLIASETAAVEAVAGEHPATTRAPAWLGSLASVLLMFGLLRRYGFARVPAGVGVVIGFGSPMFFLYGSMLDTLQIGLPFALGLLLARAPPTGPQRAVAGWLIGTLAALTVLASWEGALLVGLLSATDVIQRWRREHRWRLSQTGVGFGVGLALIAAWLWWAAGSLGPIVDQLLNRSGHGQHALGWSAFFEFQGLYLGALLSPVVIVVAIPAVISALREPRIRTLMAVTLTTTVAYAVLLRDGATNHDYWNYWLVVPLTLAAAMLCERAIVWATAGGRSIKPVLGVIVGIALMSLVTAFPTPGIPALEQYNSGMQAGRLVSHGHGFGSLYLVGHFQTNTDWLRYQGITPRLLTNGRQLAQIAANDPRAEVLVKCARREPWFAPICRRPGPPYILNHAHDVQRRLGQPTQSAFRQVTEAGPAR